MLNFKSKSSLLLLSVSGTLLFLTAFCITVWVYWDTPKPMTVEQTTPPVTTVTSIQEGDYEKTVDTLIKTGDINSCNDIGNTYYKNICVNNIVLQKVEQTGDITYCKSVDGSLITVESCERSALLNLEKGIQNLESCDMASSVDVRDECKMRILFANVSANNSKWCETLTSEQLQRKCVNDFVLMLSQDIDTALCSQLTGDDAQEDCLNLMTVLPTLRFTENTNTSEVLDVCMTQKTDTFSYLCAPISMISNHQTQ